MSQISTLSDRELQKLVHALILEWTPEVALARRVNAIDYNVTSPGVLGIQHRQRFRLYLKPPSVTDFTYFKQEADALGFVPIAILARSGYDEADTPNGILLVSAAEVEALCLASGVIERADDSDLAVDLDALRELKDHLDSRLSLTTGLLGLRPLSRNKVPPSLRWTGSPAHEMFERCFFLVMTTTFLIRGTSWGTKNRGKPMPDGLLEFPSIETPVLYDCKASGTGFKMSYSDVRSFADYLRSPIFGSSYLASASTPPIFLVISSEFVAGTRDTSFKKRAETLANKANGAKLAWMRARDLVRFGLAMERAEVIPEHREKVVWHDILESGDITWQAFQDQLTVLSSLGYSFHGEC